jgi:putative intracellular protease/amidase
MKIVCFAYDGVDTLSIACISDLIHRLPRARFSLVSPGHGPRIVRTEAGLGIETHAGTDEIAGADVLLVPGGQTRTVAADAGVIEWIARLHRTSRWTVGVGEGATLLCAAGIALPEPRGSRIARDGRIFIGPGATGVFDLLLAFVAEVWGKRWAQVLQLTAEYDPEPETRPA